MTNQETNQETYQETPLSRRLDIPSFKGDFDKDSWRDFARCKNKGFAMFFAESSGGANSYFEARCICFTCPVQKECLDFAIENSIDIGIWGGLPYRERLKYLRGKRTHELTITELVRSMKGNVNTISSLATRLGVTEKYIRNQLKKGRYKYDNR